MREEELLGLIRRIGIVDNELEDYIRIRTALGLPYFTVNASRSYGEDILNCKFYISNDGEQYNLEKYEATLKTSLIYYYPSINGVDTWLLDEQMGSVEWSKVLQEADGYNLLQKIFPSLLADLWRLSENNNEEGVAMQAFLLAKHFNTDDWGMQPYLESQRAHGAPVMTTTDFSGEFPNAHLCYYTLSGEKDLLEEQLEDIGLKLGMALERSLSKNEEDFTLSRYQFLAEGIVRYDIPFSKQSDNNYQMQDYTARLCPLPKIDHLQFNGMDTRALEQRMRQIDWANEESHYLFVDSEPRFHPQIQQIVSELHYLLPEDSQGARVASQLQLKYWLESPDFIGIINKPAWDYFDHLPARETTMPPSKHIEAAYNLLCGRAVYVGEGDWMTLDLTFRYEKSYGVQIIDGLFPEKVEQLLLAQGIGSKEIPDLIHSLLKGNRVLAHYPNGESLWMEVFPEQKTLTIASQDRMFKFTAVAPPAEQINTSIDKPAMLPDRNPVPVPRFPKKHKKKSGKRRKH